MSVEATTPSGERVLVPASHAADAQTLILVDGFGCREQIRQQTARQAPRPTEMLQWALQVAGDERA